MVIADPDMMGAMHDEGAALLAEAKTAEQPTTTEKPSEPPPVTTTDATPTDDVVILFKGDQAVLEGGQRHPRLDWRPAFFAGESSLAVACHNFHRSTRVHSNDDVIGPVAGVEIPVTIDSQPVQPSGRRVCRFIFGGSSYGWQSRAGRVSLGFAAAQG